MPSCRSWKSKYKICSRRQAILTPEILHIFVSKIVIHERRERFKQNTEQQIDIYFRYIGNVAEM